jgi:hypothetical protein
MNCKDHHAIRKQTLILLLIFIGGLLPSCGSGPGQGRQQDDAMLLMISSYTVLLEGGDEAALGLRGGARMLSLSPQVKVTSTREVDTLIELYSNLYNSNVEKVYEQYPERADQLVDRLNDQYQAKVDDLLRQKQRLQARRRRRRWGLFRRIGRGLARVARFIGRTTRTIVVEGGRLIGQYAINEIKQRVRDVFEGRVNAVIERVASKFGPLAPFVQGKLKRVLDRWWIRLRDRVSGRLVRQRQGTQTAEAHAAVERQPSTSDEDREPADLETAIDADEFAGDDECAPDRSWIPEYWKVYVVPSLKEDGKYCSDTSAYYHCLEEKADEGLCPEVVHEVCEPLYDQIFPTDPGQVVTIVDDTAYYRDSDNHLDINLPLSGGPVSGFMAVNYSEDFFGEEACVVDLTFTFSGTYDPSTCTVAGNAIKTLNYVEAREEDCLGYPEPYEESLRFGMEIRNGTLFTCSAEGQGQLLCESYKLSDYVK